MRLVAMGQALIEHDPPPDALANLADIGELIEGADVSLCNLEVALRTDAPSWPTKEGVAHSAPTSVLTALRKAGINALSLANNHIGDLGPAAVVAAQEEVRAQGFLCAGAGGSRAEAGTASVSEGNTVAVVAISAGPGPIPGAALDATSSRPARAGVNPLPVKRTILADTASFDAVRVLAGASGSQQRTEREVRSGRRGKPPADEVELAGVVIRRADHSGEVAVANPAEMARITDAVRSAASAARAVVVSIHNHDWEPDWSAPPTWLHDAARAFVDAGASAVIGHGAPVTGGIEVYRGRLIAYGMGNLIFHTARPGAYPQEEVWGGFVLDAQLAEDGAVISAQLHPVELDPLTIERAPGAGFPRLAEQSRADRIWARTGALSARYGVSVATGPDGGALSWT